MCTYRNFGNYVDIKELIFRLFVLAFWTCCTRLIFDRVHKVESDARGRVPRSMMEIQPEKVRMCQPAEMSDVIPQYLAVASALSSTLVSSHNVHGSRRRIMA